MPNFRKVLMFVRIDRQNVPENGKSQVCMYDQLEPLLCGSRAGQYKN